MIKRLCAWCGAFLGWKKSGLSLYERRMQETHGICVPCMKDQTDHAGWAEWKRLCTEVGGEG